MRPASPSGWVLSTTGQELTLTGQAQALAWLSAVDAFIDLLNRQMRESTDLGFWAYWLVRWQRATSARQTKRPGRPRSGVRSSWG